ncbi:MAG: hypothetical protein KAG66_16410 [Methylococcales bacterium]|nr:hypothetical protein [Methylococcales bacterium]
MKNYNPISWFFSLTLVLLVFLIFLPQSVLAVPAFARQMSMPCTACHFQNFPALNSFGRAFRAGGYTMVGADSVIEGEGLSMPKTLNASVIAKLRYVETNGNTSEGSDRGEIQWPDEAAILVGGRLAKNAGFLMELGLGDVASVDENDGGDVAVSANSFLSTKLHFNVGKPGKAQFSIIPYSTDGLGSPYGFELLNTGAQRSQRPIEERRGLSAAQALGLASGEATGIALVAAGSNFFFNYSPWVPGWGGINQSVKPSGLAHYLRGVYMPTIGGWDTGFGVQAWNGDASISTEDGTGGTTDIITDGWVIDAQAQGSIGGKTLGLFASYGKCDGDSGHFAGNCDNTNDADAFAILAQLGIKPNKLNIYAAYRTMDIGTNDNSDFNAWTLGANYMIAQNIRLELFHVAEDGSGVDARENQEDSKWLLQLFAGF